MMESGKNKAQEMKNDISNSAQQAKDKVKNTINEKSSDASKKA